MRAMMKPYQRFLTIPLLTLLMLLATTGAALAQEAGGTVSGSASVSASAEGGGRAGGIGVGAETMLGGISVFGVGLDVFFPTSAAAFVYDASMWRIDALLAMDSAGATDIFAGGRFWFNLHTGSASDFAVGGGIGFIADGDDGAGPGDDDSLHILVEGGIQIRAFIVPNVAVGAVAGIGFFILDEQVGDDFFFLGGQLLSSAAIWYFFD